MEALDRILYKTIYGIGIAFMAKILVAGYPRVFFQMETLEFSVAIIMMIVGSYRGWETQ